jgi:ParB family chromosome partitioning protein
MNADKRRALGRGLDALFSAPATAPQVATYGEKSVFLCPIDALVPQQGQPRQKIDDDRLDELAESLKVHGLIEPIVVRRVGTADNFEIIAGERRWRAAQRAGLKELLVVVKDVSPDTAFELALIENLQREDLDAIEVAEALDRLIREHNFTHETLAQRVHKDRSTITNSLRLLKLPARVRSMVVEGKLTEGHARALLGAPDSPTMETLADKAVRGRLSVRKIESLVRSAKEGGDSAGAEEAAAKKEKNPNIKDLEQRLERAIGLRVEVHDEKGKGEVVIRYTSLDDFDKLMAALGMGD